MNVKILLIFFFDNFFFLVIKDSANHILLHSHLALRALKIKNKKNVKIKYFKLLIKKKL